MIVKYYKQKFKYCKGIPWNDIVEKIDYEYQNDTIRVLRGDNVGSTYVLHDEYRPGKIETVFNEVKKNWGIEFMHVYTSLTKKSTSLKGHTDEEDVLIVQSVGQVLYDLGENELLLNPGDGVMLPKGQYHHPHILSPRITLSFSW